MKKTTGLGRGLDALIDTTRVESRGSSSICDIPLDRIVANPDQPRRTFDEDALAELADSIREHGVISPITLRRNADDTYLIIAGERRYRASHLAGLTSIPAYVRTARDEQVMEMALIENIQREDLDAIEVALAYQRLMDDYHLTQEQMSERVGKKRTTITNYLRLLHLPAEIQMGLKNRLLDMGHARALLGAKTPQLQLDIYQRILRDGLSVRTVEQMVKDAENETPTAPKKPVLSYPTQEKTLADRINHPVRIAGGKILIAFKDENELNEILGRLI